MVNGPLMSARWSPDVGKKAVGTPNAPSISEVNEASGQLTVTWTAPTSNGGSAITDYEVSATDGANTITDTTGDDSLTLALSGLTNGSSYTITVRAKNSDFWSTSSSPSSPHTPLGVPGAPTALVLTPTSNGFSATWVAPNDDGGDGDGTDLGNYDYQVEDSGGTIVLAWTTTGSSSTGYSITNLSPTTTYTVKVRATNVLHNGTAFDSANATTLS